MVTVGPGRSTVTVTAGWGTGTLTVIVGAGFPPPGALVAASRAGNVMATITASAIAAAMPSNARDRSRFRTFLRRLLPGRGACGVITPLMVNLGAASRRGTERSRPRRWPSRHAAGADAAGTRQLSQVVGEEGRDGLDGLGDIWLGVVEVDVQFGV